MDAHAAPGPHDKKDRKDSVDDYNVFDDAQTYYTDSRHKVNRATARTRTFSQVCYVMASSLVPMCTNVKTKADIALRRMD